MTLFANQSGQHAGFERIKTAVLALTEVGEICYAIILSKINKYPLHRIWIDYAP